ncbi:MAG: phage tail tube protein [Xanthobacteraceae bacterium]
MATATTIKGGKFRILLGDDANPIVYSAPCGFTSRSLTLTKGLEEVNIPSCDDPDAVDWVGRDATSLSMSVSGEGVLAAESSDTWLDAWHSVDSVPVKIEIEFPAKTITYTGKMHVESLELGAPNGQRVTNNVSMQSDGEMVRVTTPAS